VSAIGIALGAVAPALPLHTAGKYVAGAYIVFLAILLVYVAIMAARLARTERELAELAGDVEAARSPLAPEPPAPEPPAPEPPAPEPPGQPVGAGGPVGERPLA